MSFENDQERSDRVYNSIGCIVVSICGSGILALLFCGLGIFLLASESGESTPLQAREWFKTVVYADTSAFTEIQHFTDQGIDFSHHFRFRFSDLKDLQPIIDRYGLKPAPQSFPMQGNHLPDWYDPFSVPQRALKFGCDGYEPILLIVIPDEKIAYFEMVHL